jgi:HSP20 family protein
METLTKNGHNKAAPNHAVRRNTYTPRVDVLETDEGLTLYADLPGVEPADLELHFENNELTLHGKAKPRPGAGYREYDVGDFRRVFRVASEIDANRISATLKNGVLTLHLPKSDRIKPRTIAVQGA